ncbi:mechanosensitive ion channel [bacterium]|nr:mechanosensitive ion channel [bacterium]MBU1074093.1 mechanosensitive ion channel [bacterium]MBU1676629.1 mechanosensitive ion channel [bacterium]
MDTGFSLKTAATDVLSNLASAIAEFVPRAFTGLVVVLLGILLAKLAEKAIRTAFDKFRLDELLGRVGLTDILGRLGLRRPPGQILARLVYWMLVLLFTQSAAQAVGLTVVAEAIAAFFSYTPNIIAAALVLLVGMMVSRFVGEAITRAAADSGVEFAPTLGRAASALIFFVVAVMAVSQLRIDTELVKSVVLVLLSGMAVALALTFGLGTRDVTRNIVAGYYVRKLFRVGETVNVAGESGTLTGVTSLQTLIERDGEIAAVPNKVFLEEVARR